MGTTKEKEMNEVITNEDVFAVMKTFCELNRGDEATEDLILSIGAELLGISVDRMCDLALGK